MSRIELRVITPSPSCLNCKHCTFLQAYDYAIDRWDNGYFCMLDVSESDIESIRREVGNKGFVQDKDLGTEPYSDMCNKVMFPDESHVFLDKSIRHVGFMQCCQFYEKGECQNV